MDDEGRKPAVLIEEDGTIEFRAGLENYLPADAPNAASIESLQELFGPSVQLGRPCAGLDEESRFCHELFDIQSLAGVELPTPLAVKIVSILSLGGGCYRVVLIEEMNGGDATLQLLESTERALKLISQYSRALVKAGTEEEILQVACDLLVNVGGYAFAWIGIPGFDQDKSVIPVAQAGEAGEGYLEGVRISWGDNELGRGPTGRAIREKKAVVERNIPESPLYPPWRKDALQRGFLSSAAIPLRLDGNVVGVVNVYSSRQDAFGPKELGLLTQIADNISLGIDRIRAKQAYQETLGSLRQSQLLFETISRAAPDAVIVMDENCKITFWNEAAEEVFGYSESEVVGKEFVELIVEARLRDAVRDVLGKTACGEATGVRRLEITAIDKLGQRLPVELSVTFTQTNSHKIGILFARDITEWKISEARWRESSRKLEKLHEIARTLESLHDEDEVYKLTVKAAESILHFSLCTLDIVDDDRFVVKATSEGVPEGASISVPINVRTIAAKTYFMKETIVVGDVREEPDAKVTMDSFRSLVSAPFGDIGVFQAASPILNAFTREDVRFLELLLGHAFQAVKRIRLENDLKEQAIRDPLTGVFNRRYFNQVIEHELYRSARYSHPIGFLMIDIDRFKEINDRFGHQVGDKVLQAVAQFLKRELRASDVVIRYGGDEFLAMLLETDGQTEGVKERLERRISKDPVIQNLVSFPITLSIGSAHWEPTINKPIEEILAEADRRMYEEKRKHQSSYRREVD